MKSRTFLDKIRIATPCPANWEEMEGSDRIRFCSLCQQNVYSVDKMTLQEVVDLVKEKEGKLCVDLYRRSDGTVLTQNCDGGPEQQNSEPQECRIGGISQHSVAAILKHEARQKKRQEKEAEKKRLKEEKNKNRSRPYY